MTLLNALFGEGKDLDALQTSVRAIVVFFVALVLIRIAGRRSFGQRSPFDYVFAILLGATLARAIVGASGFVPTVGASLALAVLHRLIGLACVRWPRFERLMVGFERVVYHDGRFDEGQMAAALITRADVQESARQTLGEPDLSKVQAAILERNGQISLIRRNT